MARLTKQVDKWFDVPNDPDNAKIKIKHLKPGEVEAIEQEANPVVLRPDGGKFSTEITIQVAKKSALLINAAVLDWEGFYNTKGNKIQCNSENKKKAAKEFSWLANFVAECVENLRIEVEGELEEAEKN